MKEKINKNKIAIVLIQLLKDAKKDAFREVIKELMPYDIAEQYNELPVKHRPLFLEYLDVPQLTSLLRHLTRDEQLQVLRILKPVRSVELLELMKNDDLAFLLSGLKDSQIEKLITQMKHEESVIVRRILAYPEKSAGRKMSDRYVWIDKKYTIEQAIEKLKHFSELAEYLNYLYVIDEHKKLVGVVSYRDLLLADSKTTVDEIMTKNIVSVDVYTKQQEVAKLIARHDFVSIPVVIEDNTLVGIITVDDVLDIIMREADEDIEMLLASGKAIDFKTKPLVAAYRRLPWLILLLFIGLVSGSIIAKFEATLEAVVALAFFMPMIAGMTGNTGTQSLAVVVRGLVTEDLNTKQAIKLIFRELIVGIIIGITCAIIISVIAYVWQGSLVLGLVVGSSLLITLIIGTIAGTVIPLILHKFKVDPAVASGPLITTINDILSLLIYFGIATMFISRLM
ncbi:magnesium transporter [Sporosarcina siberiensis]|uniref:Magnesium transporter MgtE n=1 Tax=Sporosarcina siberiensis TaxID=1365606 RepID=A0ABW4SLB5_9BACL